MVPLGVVLPRDSKDVVQTVAVCRRHGVNLHGRGGGTGIPGQTVNDGIVIDFSKYMNSIIEVDIKKKLARVEPGLVHDTLRDALKQHKLTFGPDPATHNRCTFGGMIGNNSCGVHSQMAGRTADNIAELDIVLYDGTVMTVGKTDEDELERIIKAGGRKGEIYAKLKALRDKYADRIRECYPKIPRRVSGYNLDELLPENSFHVARALVGSEGTCMTVLSATVHLVYDPPVRSLLVLGYKDVFEAADHVVDVLPFNPIGLEGLDHNFIDDMTKKGLHDPAMSMIPEGNGWLLCEFGGENKEESDAPARKLMEHLKKRPNAPSMKLFDSPSEEAHIWHLREEGLGATADVPGKPENHEGWEDSAVPPAKLGKYMRDLKKLMQPYGYEGAFYGHFGQGCMHTRLNFDLRSVEGIANYRRFVQEAADLCVQYGGSLSGEHGDGQLRGELLPRMFGKELVDAFREFKEIWDPDWKMNPGKIIAPYRLDEHLYEGADYNPADPVTYFRFPGDNFSFAKAANRCVGAGVCRRHHGGTMCPSYMVTMEEEHSTRGRARLLFEMVGGKLIKDGWKSEEVKSSLDLCLSCKGCKDDCPVQVDMATYKAEFLAHYYEGSIRPRHAYAFGLIGIWAKLATSLPGLAAIANGVMQFPGLSAIGKAIAGMDQKRTVPAFAPRNFKDWFHDRKPRNVGGPKVILWADTFNNHFHPTTAQAAVEVLEDAGFWVNVPTRNFCCGRPLYDYGFLVTAKNWLQEILTGLSAEIQAGTPVVVLEPSCASVFRDELINLLGDNEDAKRLSENTYLLSEFLNKKAPDYNPPKLKRKALVHGHCHHKAIMKMKDEDAILKKMGVDFQSPDSGCCGMAGAFGFEEGEHYDVSIKCGERALLPDVRKADKDTLIVADGFSCREQIKQSTDRQALHLAQVMQMALHEGEAGAKGNYPERDYVKLPFRDNLKANAQAALILGIGAAAIGAGVKRILDGGRRTKDGG